MAILTRYDSLSIAASPLDPIEDVTSWICGLNSSGYTSDILAKVHGISPAATVNQCAQMVSQFASTAVGLLEQGYSGPADISFLPLYYAILNLSKIFIIAAGKYQDLPSNRRHGVSYNPIGKSSHDLINEEIKLHPKGIFPLFYSILAPGSFITQERKVALNSIYPHLRGISYEYGQAYGLPSPLQLISISMTGTSDQGFRLKATLHKNSHPNAGNLRFLKAITGFKRTTTEATDLYSKIINAPSEEEAKPLLANKVRRYLLYETIFDPLQNPIGNITPLSNSRLLLPEEIPIWLAFFHLSNIVRYNPEFLHKSENSKAWPMLLSMRKHTLLRFLLLFWSFFHQCDFLIRPQ